MGILSKESLLAFTLAQGSTLVTVVILLGVVFTLLYRLRIKALLRGPSSGGTRVVLSSCAQPLKGLRLIIVIFSFRWVSSLRSERSPHFRVLVLFVLGWAFVCTIVVYEAGSANLERLRHKPSLRS